MCPCPSFPRQPITSSQQKEKKNNCISMVVCLKDFLWIVKGTGKYQLVHLIIADPKRHNKTSVWVFPLINLPSALIYNMLQLSHGEEEKLTPIFNKSLFLNLFHTEVLFHPPISAPGGLLTTGLTVVFHFAVTLKQMKLF